MIKLGLSGRIIEEHTEDGLTYQMPVVDFIARVAEIGYLGIELRTGQMNHKTNNEEVAEVARALGSNNVACAFVNYSAQQTPDALPHMRRMAEIARQLATPYVRMGVNDIKWVQQACDIAEEYEVSCIAQIHTNTPLETVEGALRVCARVDRDNFGLSYEPANFVLAGRDYGPKALEQLADKLFNVSIQNLKPVIQTEGESVIMHQGLGFVRCHPGDPEGIDFKRVFSGLKSVGYNGYATVIEPISQVMESLELAQMYFDKLSPLC